MRAPLFAAFCATALAIPSAVKKHHHHHHQNLARDYVYKTKVVTEVVTVTWNPNPTANPQPPTYNGVSHNVSDQDDEEPAPVHAQEAPAQYKPPAKLAPVHHVDSKDDDVIPVHEAPKTDEKKPATKPEDDTTDIPSTPDTPDVQDSTKKVTTPKEQPYAGAPKAGKNHTPQDTTHHTSKPPSYRGGKIKGKNMVIFGDNLSDRGNGSVDHNVEGGNSDIYTYKTWTNGKIAAEVLADKLHIPIKYDYAFGHSDGGSNFGATVDNEFTQSNSHAPSCADQIKNYTSNGAYYDKSTVGDSIHFLWCGNNDVLPWAMPTPESVVKCNTSHIFTGPGQDEGNAKFASELAMILSMQVQKLLDAGAKNIFVPNIYPRHLAPVVGTYFTAIAKGVGQVEQYGKVIQQANSNLKKLLSDMQKTSGANIVYYDAFAFLVDLYENRAAHGFTRGNKAPEDICDDGKDMDKLINCSPRTTGKYIGDEFYWMEYLDMSAKVHRILAEDMAGAFNAAGF